jgi:broad specificity phosphatase PhoE
MTILYLVRHGQASFGADDYDKLSDLGWQQARWLGDYFAQRGVRFGKVVRGSLRRHDETLQGILESYTAGGGASTPSTQELPGLNEYDTEPVLHAKLGDAASKHQQKALAQDKRQYFQVLREALREWSDGSLIPHGEGSYAAFRARVLHAFDQACTDPGALPVLVVSSGGPISNIVGQLLQVPNSVTIDLNLQTRNASFAEIAFNSKSRRIMSFNSIPHLDHPERLDKVTYA